MNVLQFEKVPFGFAKRAKRIDVRRLKEVMWSCISDIPKRKSFISTTPLKDTPKKIEPLHNGDALVGNGDTADTPMKNVR